VSKGFSIQPVRPQDVPAVVAMVHELAEYERAADECHLSPDDLHTALFGPSPALFGHVAYDPTGAPIGAMLWFLNFSTWTGRHGIYLEDLYVRPAARGGGVGAAMLATLAEICVQRGYSRLDWSVLEWNPAREFYHRLGAAAVSGWLPYRLTGTALSNVASSSPGAIAASTPHASTPGASTPGASTPGGAAPTRA
jgi:GNAT superfamily N-acetyltransferase